MKDPIYRLARRLNPALETLTGQRRMGATADVFTWLYTLPLALAALGWLAVASDWQAAAQNWLVLALTAVLVYLFNRLSFFLITEIRSGGYANTQGALDDMALWAAVLLVGPVALWIEVAANLLTFIRGMRGAFNATARWSQLRIFTANLASNVLSFLPALLLYRTLGGTLPMADLNLGTALTGMAAILMQFIFRFIIYSGYIGYVVWGLKYNLSADPRPALMFFVYAFALPALANPFGILAAALYVEQGPALFTFDMIGLLLVAFLARRLSQAAEVSRQQSRQLGQLEQLSRALLGGPPDASTLPELLNQYVPNMFARGSIAIWVEPERMLLMAPEEWSVALGPAWNWLRTQTAESFFLVNDPLPWEEKLANHPALVLAPILNVDTGRPFGVVYLELQALGLPWDANTIRALLPAVQSLSAQVASALHQAHVYQESLSLQKTLQEIHLARSIQASFLPENLPQLPGWSLAVTLEPARQMAGDFYDFIPLPEGRLGIIIADVADKGLGPALYMALSRTLIRSYAEQFPTEPARVLEASNRRILTDARANLFVTVFYGVLDPISGSLAYANAGHTPPYLISPNDGEPETQTLRNTGMPLGIDEESTWRQEMAEMHPGDVLLLYTDGVTDAQNSRGEFIDRRFIVDVACRNLAGPVGEIQQAILNEVHGFVGDAPRFDDITMVILGREPISPIPPAMGAAHRPPLPAGKGG